MAALNALLRRRGITDDVTAGGRLVLRSAAGGEFSKALSAVDPPARVLMGVSRDHLYFFTVRPGEPGPGDLLGSVPRDGLLVFVRPGLSGRVLVLDNADGRIKAKARRVPNTHASDVIDALR